MKIDTKDFLVRPGEKVKLKDWPTKVNLVRLERGVQEGAGEARGGAEFDPAASLRIEQICVAADLSGDGRSGQGRRDHHVMSGVNPQGCEVSSFKQPSAEELKHDFLWRTTRRCRSAGGSGSSTARTTRRCWWSGFTRRSSSGDGWPLLLDKRPFGISVTSSIVDLENHLYRNGTQHRQNLSSPVERGAAKTISCADRRAR